MNQVLLSGTITVAPTTKRFDSGSSVTEATLRVEGRAKKGEAPRYDDVRIDAWGDTGKALAATHVGSRVIITGKVRVNTWTAQDGSPRSRTGISVDSVEQLADAHGSAPTAPAYAEPPEPIENLEDAAASRDEIPF